MRIATLQFNPVLGAVEQNMNTATSLLESSTTVYPTDIDLLVLPELAFSGYNFNSIDHIRPYLEPTTAGPTTRWAVETAMRCDCYVLVGYPEISTRDDKQPSYNSLVVISPEGRILRNYRKSFLYYTDETWASEGFNSSSDGQGNPTLGKAPFFCGDVGDLVGLGLGICMDINPYRFVAPWTDYEFANHMLENRAKLVILSMAWITRLLPDEMAAEPDKPDMETVAYWLERFHPFVEKAPEEEVIVVFANRCGTEGKTNSSIAIAKNDPVEQGDRVCYAGSSCIMRFQGGNVRMFEKRPNEVAVLGK